MPPPTNIAELEDLLSVPSERAIQVLRETPGDLLILGVGGKMGPTLARMARRAAEAAGSPRRVIGVSRFSDETLRQRLESWDVETWTCDLLDQQSLADLPDAPNVVFMAGMKFGAHGSPARTWAMNCHLPALVAQRFRDSRIVVFSSGNVYGLTRPERGGSTEDDLPGPIGEYAMSVLGRERMFEHFSQRFGTRVVTLRLNYAVEPRYGVLVDLARQVLSESSIDVSMGYVNVIWQADANAMALASLAQATSPPKLLNLAGPEILHVRDVCERFGRLLHKPVEFTGDEHPDALLNNGARAYPLLGAPQVVTEDLIEWTADWLLRGGETLAKPTKFQARDGRF